MRHKLTASVIPLRRSAVPVIRYDRYVSSSGNDSNDGLTPATAWLTFAKVNTYVSSLSAGSNKAIKVAAGNYIGNGLTFANLNGAITVRVDFAPGVTVDTSGAATSNGLSCANSVTATFNCNGATFTGIHTSSANGASANNSANIVVNNGTFTSYDDGWSLHDASTSTVNDCVFSNGNKSAFSHVNTSSGTANRCTFNGKSGASLGVGANQSSNRFAFNDCIFTPSASNQIITLDKCDFSRCTIGSFTGSVNSGNMASAVGATFTDCFINLIQESFGNCTWTRCFGKMTIRMRGSASVTGTLRHCALVGPATSASSSNWHYQNFYSAGTFEPNTVTLEDTIFTGYATVIDTGGNTTVRDNINARWTMNYLCSYNNTAFAASGVNAPAVLVTTNPLLVSPTTTTQSDYDVSAGSPCIGAGSADSDIGLNI